MKTIRDSRSLSLTENSRTQTGPIFSLEGLFWGNKTLDIFPRLPWNRAEAYRRKEVERRQIFDSITGSKSW